MASNYGSSPPPPPPPPHPPQSYTPEVAGQLPAYTPPRPPKPNSPAPNRISSTPPGGPHQAPPPPIDPNFLPPGIADKSLSDLKTLASSPPLMNALFQSTHPIATHCSTTLTHSLSETSARAHRLLALESTLTTARLATTTRLQETKALEAHWQEKEKEMYRELQRWSEKSLYTRLVNAAAESEGTAESLERAFFGGEGEGVEEFVKEYRAVRKLEHLRKERKCRWDEGRIGGWR